ncbi:MAG: response regulator, partial [Phaeodactylibacter sp.]|nr:response regulator [Phaeodactylibacter sp.]
DQWVYTSENKISINYLPYGRYNIKVKGRGAAGAWSEMLLSVPVWVKKPFYLQWWFLLAALVSGIGVIAAAIYWRINKLKRDRARLEAEVQKRTRQIEEDKQTIAAQAEALKELDKAKSRFFSNITHEFRTPLTLIIGPLEQALAENPPPSILRRRMQGVIKNARHILGLINQLLDLSKMESGRMVVEAVRGDIVAYTRELAMQFQPLAGKKELRLHFISDQGSWEANFDRDKWDKVVYNLLSNAIKFTPPGNVIQLSIARACQEGREFIRLDVKDTGIGIDEEQIERVFDRFYQAPSPPRSPQGGEEFRNSPPSGGLGGAGTGIGLALVKELVELQGGKVVVSSEVGKGTSFCILLPVLQAENIKPLAGRPAADVLSGLELAASEAAPQAKTPAEDNKEKLELLIIEDNEEMREYIRYCLGEDKYHITEAADGQEGIEKAQALIPDLIISDVMMPKKDGFAVTQAIRGNLSTSHIPLILLTAKASLESRLEGLQRGADAYLTKPFSPQELALRTGKLIEIRRLLQQRYQNASPPDEGGAYRQEDEFITELRAYVLEHIDDADLSGDRIGRHFGMSRVHLYRKLKALTGQSITEFVKAVRLQKALELIREGKHNVSEIAYQTGFSSVSHFSRSFKQVFGKAPSEV